MIAWCLDSLVEFPIRPLKRLIALPNLDDGITPDPARLIALDQLASVSRIDPDTVPGEVRDKKSFHNVLPFWVPGIFLDPVNKFPGTVPSVKGQIRGPCGFGDNSDEFWLVVDYFDAWELFGDVEGLDWFVDELYGLSGCVMGTQLLFGFWLLNFLFAFDERLLLFQVWIFHLWQLLLLIIQLIFWLDL